MSIAVVGGITSLSVATVTLTTTTDTQVIAAPSSEALYIYSIQVSNGSETLMRCDVREGTTVKWSMYLAPNAGGFIWAPKEPWKLAAATALKVQLGTAPASNDVRFSVHYLQAP